MDIVCWNGQGTMVIGLFWYGYHHGYQPGY
jgi:hypothetical protein